MRVRRSIQVLENEYEQAVKNGQSSELEYLVQAWEKVRQLSASDPKNVDSFFTLAGYHGMPSADLSVTWGGYCHHANVLFPTWHRAYCYKLEQVLNKYKPAGAPDLSLPYLDETNAQTATEGIPNVFTDDEFLLSNGTKISNPLKSFTMPCDVKDTYEQTDDTRDFTKRTGYNIVRYPYNGLDFDDAQREKSRKENEEIDEEVDTVQLLNKQFKYWSAGDLGSSAVEKYTNCLDAPNYTVFSNTASAEKYDELTNAIEYDPLEEPHNDGHLAIGTDMGYEEGKDLLYPDASGDMGINEVAGFDPIFFFHHCNVDRMFWLWQVKHNATENLVIDHNLLGYKDKHNVAFPGTLIGESLPDHPLNEELTLDTLLQPFMKDNSEYFTSKDVINIKTQLGYDYSEGSLDTRKPTPVTTAPAKEKRKFVRVYDISLDNFVGSFVIKVYAVIGRRKVLLGRKSVLSRVRRENCTNCKSKNTVAAVVPLKGRALQFFKDHHNQFDVMVKVVGIRGRRHRRSIIRLSPSEFEWKVMEGRKGRH